MRATHLECIRISTDQPLRLLISVLTVLNDRLVGIKGLDFSGRLVICFFKETGFPQSQNQSYNYIVNWSIWAFCFMCSVLIECQCHKTMFVLLSKCLNIQIFIMNWYCFRRFCDWLQIEVKLFNKPPQNTEFMRFRGWVIIKSRLRNHSVLSLH